MAIGLGIQPAWDNTLVGTSDSVGVETSTGDAIIVIAATSRGIPTVTDTVGHTYTLVWTNGPTGGSRNFTLYCFATYNVAANPGTNTVTITQHAGASGGLSWGGCTVTGLAATQAFDSFNNNSGVGTALTSGSVTTHFANAFLLGVGTMDGITNGTWTGDGADGYSGIFNIGTASPGFPLIAIYKVVSATGSYATKASFTQSNNWLMTISDFTDTPSSPTLTASSGSFSVNGQAATLSTGSGNTTISAATGAFTLSGIAAGLTLSGAFELIAATGAFDVVGEISESDYELEPAAGIFSTFGPPVTLSENSNPSFGFTGNVGLFGLTGFTANLSISVQFSFSLDTGFFTIVGEDSSTTLSCNCIGTTGAIDFIVLNLELVSDAFQMLGIIDETEAPSAEQGVNGLRLLNDMMLNQQRDGLRVGWWKQTQLEVAAPLRQEDVWGVKRLLARQIASFYGITIQNPLLLQDIADAERMLTKRSLRYFESDLSELSRPQGGPWGGPNWL